jgi:predicted regulator of Ras-like GTPase activity (Roadblock/LC7/MglB family)
LVAAAWPPDAEVIDRRFDSQQNAATESALQATLLEPGKVIERELSTGKQHSYQIMLVKGQYARVMVEQQGIDVVIRVSGPDGKMIAVADSELGNQGREKAELVAESDGPHLVKVEVAEGAATGRYLIQIEELRTASEKDVLAQEARKVDIEATRLYDHHLDEALAVAGVPNGS